MYFLRRLQYNLAPAFVRRLTTPVALSNKRVNPRLLSLFLRREGWKWNYPKLQDFIFHPLLVFHVQFACTFTPMSNACKFNNQTLWTRIETYTSKPHNFWKSWTQAQTIPSKLVVDQSIGALVMQHVPYNFMVNKKNVKRACHYLSLFILKSS